MGPGLLAYDTVQHLTMPHPHDTVPHDTIPLPCLTMLEAIVVGSLASHRKFFPTSAVLQGSFY